jgi:hypothetical protein
MLASGPQVEPPLPDPDDPLEQRLDPGSDAPLMWRISLRVHRPGRRALSLSARSRASVAIEQTAARLPVRSVLGLISRHLPSRWSRGPMVLGAGVLRRRSAIPSGPRYSSRRILPGWMGARAASRTRRSPAGGLGLRQVSRWQARDGGWDARPTRRTTFLQLYVISASSSAGGEVVSWRAIGREERCRGATCDETGR